MNFEDEAERRVLRVLLAVERTLNSLNRLLETLERKSQTYPAVTGIDVKVK